MRFLADMGVDQRIVRWLQQNGDDAIHLRDEGLQRLPDPKIFDKAHSEHRVILTFDLDFGEVTAFSGGRIVSVVLSGCTIPGLRRIDESGFAQAR